ncbi:MAG: hypothetical protein Q8O70_12135, partial [Burkholderiales bacterium]|nr:hypothetical protein [Burkholderiales bacterium]
ERFGRIRTSWKSSLISRSMCMVDASQWRHPDAQKSARARAAQGNIRPSAAREQPARDFDIPARAVIIPAEEEAWTFR